MLLQNKRPQPAELEPPMKYAHLEILQASMRMLLHKLSSRFTGFVLSLY